jgi:integrase
VSAARRAAWALRWIGLSLATSAIILSPYALRHLFSTLLTEAHAHDAAHDRFMGHRPKDTKTLNYSAKLLPFLVTEIERIPFELPERGPFAESEPIRVAESPGTPYAA